VQLETTIEIDSYFKIPVHAKKWEVRKEVRRITYKLATITKGGIFGHEEILN
jgi:hypothetical protein